jgi:hypothetical protein
MFFGRRKRSRPGDRRSLYRSRVLNPEQLTAHVVTPSRGFVSVEVVDMSIRGVGLRVPFEHDPELSAGDLVEVQIACDKEGWTISTPAQARQRHQPDERHIQYGFEFVNTGDLYAQLEDALGRYFNRRRSPRVRPADDAQPKVRLHCGTHRTTGTLNDLSVLGMSVIVPHVAAAQLEVGDEVELSFTLPEGRGPLEGSGFVRHRRRMGPNDLVGIEFDLSRASSLSDGGRELATYVDDRLAATNATTFVVAGAAGESDEGGGSDGLLKAG